MWDIDQLADCGLQGFAELQETGQWYNLGHVQNDADGRPMFLHRTDAKLSPGAERDIAYITSPIGPESFKRYHYDKENIRVLDAEFGHEGLICNDMDTKTVAIMQEVDSSWWGIFLPVPRRVPPVICEKM